MSLLTTGPVGVGDRIGYTDVDLVHRSDCFISALEVMFLSQFVCLFDDLSLSKSKVWRELK